MAEINDQQAQALLGAKRLMDQLLSDPRTRATTERAIKQLHPSVQTTDDLAAPYVQRFVDLEKKIDGYMKHQAEREIDGQLNSSFGRLRAQGYTDEGIEKIKKIMVDEKIPNPEAAAAWWEKKNPPEPQLPSTFSPSDWGLGRDNGDEDLKLLFKDEDGFAERETRRVFDELARENNR